MLTKDAIALAESMNIKMSKVIFARAAKTGELKASKDAHGHLVFTNDEQVSAFIQQYKQTYPSFDSLGIGWLSVTDGARFFSKKGYNIEPRELGSYCRKKRIKDAVLVRYNNRKSGWAFTEEAIREFFVAYSSRRKPTSRRTPAKKVNTKQGVEAAFNRQAMVLNAEREERLRRRAVEKRAEERAAARSLAENHPYLRLHLTG